MVNRDRPATNWCTSQSTLDGNGQHT